MKLITALAFLAIYGFAVQSKELHHVRVTMPGNVRHTAAEWREIRAAQVASPEPYPHFKRGSKPQPANAGKVYVPVSSRITHGETASRGQFPWQVALYIDGSSFCGGSIISDQWILTAAHCAGSSYEIILGANRIDQSESGSLVVTTRTSIVHEGYNPSTLNNDVRVVQLSQPVSPTDYISPIRLPSPNLPDLTGILARVSGWGKTSDASGTVSNTLQYADLRVITNDECASYYGSIINASKVCVATPGGMSTCNGDSGGPLVVQENDGLYTQVGVVSFVSSAGCESGAPAGFSRVTSFLDWIESNTGVRL